MLRTMAAAKPDDPFAGYGLAMELAKLEDPAEARQAFEGLVRRHPAYVPTYLMFGNFLRRIGEVGRAAEVYELGVVAARDAGDDHALDELRSARAELP